MSRVDVCAATVVSVAASSVPSVVIILVIGLTTVHLLLCCIQYRAGGRIRCPSNPVDSTGIEFLLPGRCALITRVRGAHMHIKIPCFQLFSLSHQSCTHFSIPRGRPAPRRGHHSKGARDGGAPHAAVGPGLTGTSPPAGKLHTRSGHVRECAVAVGDPELGLAVPFPWVVPFPRPGRLARPWGYLARKGLVV